MNLPLRAFRFQSPMLREMLNQSLGRIARNWYRRGEEYVQEVHGCSHYNEQNMNKYFIQSYSIAITH